MTLEYEAIKFRSAHEAIQWTEAAGGTAILLDGPKVVTRAEAERLGAAGVEFAYLHDWQRPDGMNVIVTVPIN